LSYLSRVLSHFATHEQSLVAIALGASGHSRGWSSYPPNCLQDAYRIRRIYRRLAGMRGRGHLHRLTVFIRHETVLRLLEFLGYRQEE
jgi:hypothetical protein